MTHRDELFDLVLRWLNDDLRVEDGRAVTRIFLYESAVSAFLVDRMIRLLGNIFPLPFHVERIRQKQLLRERIVQHLPNGSDRSCRLAENYRENPEYFFPRLPVDAVLITDSYSRLSAIGRVKRLSRVAEKAAFRLVEALFIDIKAEAERIAEQRAKTIGLPLSSLVSSEEAMRQDLVDAELAVARRFRDKKVRLNSEALTVNDLIGFKIIGLPEQLATVPDRLQSEPGVTIKEVEQHSGDYNAVNLLVDVALPSVDRIVAFHEEFDWAIAALKGLDAARAKKEFADYLSEGSTSVRVEVILTTYDDLMESEFGRSMHELRVLRLRHRQGYSGPIAQNAAYLIEYLLTMASSPTVIVPELPVKMYGRYLPETIIAEKCALFGNQIDGGLLDAFCMESDCLNRFCSIRRAADASSNHVSAHAPQEKTGHNGN